MLRLSLLLSFVCISISFAQPITDEQEITLPDYILSPSNEDITSENTKPDLAEAFEDELANLLKYEQEYLPKFKFTANIFILNKSNNKTINYSLENGLTVLHKSLEIKALNCLQNYSSVNDNDYIFLEVLDRESQNLLYRGWMSLRLPGLAPFNHQTYSIKVKNCSVSKELNPEPAEEQPEEVQQPAQMQNMDNILQPLNLR